MKLPDIEYGGQPESSQAPTQKGAAIGQASDVFERGLSAIGQEIVKTQHYAASADLLSGLEDAQIDLRKQKTLTTQQLRDSLGADFDSLPPEIKSLTTKARFNPATLQMEETDREDIPMYAVGGHIFDTKAKKILADAEGNFSSGGWASEFHEQAGKEIIQQKQKLAMRLMYDAAEHMKEKATVSAIDLANAGRADEARTVINGSSTLEPADKEKLLAHVDKIDQTRPLYEALRTGNIGDMARLLPQLGDSGLFTKLSPEDRTSFTHRFEAEIRDFQHHVKTADDERLKANAQEGWNRILTLQREGNPVAYNDIPMPGTIKAEDQKGMIEYVDKLNKGEKPQTDPGTYAALADLAANNRDKFMKVDLTKYIGRLSEPTWQHFVDMQVGLKGGNPNAYDDFQSTDEAINAALADPKIGINVHDHDVMKSRGEDVGFVKSMIQHNLAGAQESNGGKKLDLGQRDEIIKRTLDAAFDPRRSRFFGFSTTQANLIAREAGVDFASAASFQRAMYALDPSTMGGTDPEKKVGSMKKHYADYQAAEPYIDSAWKVLRGRAIGPDDSVQVWYYVTQNRSRLEGRLQAEGGWTPNNDAANNERVVQLAISEILRSVGR